MPTDVSGLITPSYDAVINVASDTEVLTQAALTDTAVALGDRIAFVRESVTDIAIRPEGVMSFRDDFLGGQLDTVNNKFYSEVPWKLHLTGGTAIPFAQGVGANKNPGLLAGVCTGGTSSEFGLELNAKMSFANFEYFCVVLKASDDAANSDHGVSFGIGNDASTGSFNPDVGGTNSLMCYYWKTQSTTQWRQVRTVSGSTFLGNTLGTFVSGQFVKIEAVKQTNGDIQFLFNESLATTTSLAQMPSGDCTFFLKAKMPSSDPNAFNFSFDFVQVRSRIADRRGV